MMRDVNDNELVSNSYSLIGIYNIYVVEPERAPRQRRSMMNRGILGGQSSLFSGVKF